MPPELNMAGILDITMQVLGLSYDMLREKAVEHLGEDNVALMEEVWGFIEAAISGGLSGLWEHVQGYLDGLWDAVIGGIQEFLMEKIIVAAVTKLASMFNPVAAIVQALMTAWDLYCWARDQMQRIYGVVTAFIDSMSDMATGNIDPAANKIEDSLAGLVPVAIDLLASILGLGGISDKVKGVIESVQQMVSDAIDSMIENVKGMFPGGGDQDEAETEGGAEEGEEAADEERSKYGGADAPESALANVVNSMPVPEIMGDDQGHTAHLTASGQIILTSTPTVAKPEHEGALRAQLEGDATGEVYIDPRSTLDEAGEYGKFKKDFQSVAEEVGLSAADSEAEKLWMLAVELCQTVNADAAGAPSYADRPGVEIPAGQEEESKKRKDLQSATFKKIIEEFQPLINGFAVYMEAWNTMNQNTQWAFWSGQPGMAMATKHMGGRALEASPIGVAFNRCKIPGHDNFQLWPALSTAYAEFAGEKIAEREYHGFLGRGSGVEASVWNMVEQPILVQMAGKQRTEVPKVRWHACKGMANAPSTIDESVSDGDNGWVGTIESSDDRAAMVALADQEMGDMKRRVVPLLADKVESAVDWKADVVTRHWMNTEILKAHYKKNDANDDEGIRFGEEVVAGSRQAGKDKLNASTDLIFKEYWEVDVTRDESTVDTNAFRDWLVTTKASKARTLFLEAMGESAENEMKRIGRAYVANEPVMLMNEIEAISYNINDGNYGKFGVAPPRESDHKGYKPVGLTWDADKQNFEYGYEGQGASFKGSLGKDGIIQDLSGEGLHLKKDAGIFGRGATGDAGRSTANSNQNASHLIADQFMGSGYKAAENLITTSDRYNQTVMSGVEGQIKEKVMAFIERAAEANFDRVDVTFGLKVELEWFSVVGTDAIQSMLADPAFCEELLHAYEGWEQSTLVEKIKETLVTWMNGQSANLMRVKECTYTLTLPEMGEIGSETHLLSAGPDLYMGLLSMGQ
jgi:hypothetical protein